MHPNAQPETLTGEQNAGNTTPTTGPLDRALLGALGLSEPAARTVMQEIEALRAALLEPIRRRVWWLMIDVHNAGGGDAELFGSEEEFNARLREIIEEGIDEEGGVGEACEGAQVALDAGDIETAWRIFRDGTHDDGDGIAHPDDYYYYGEEDVTFPALAPVRTAAAVVEGGAK